jgi:hypothetical protein
MPLHFAVNCTAFTFPVRTASKIESDFKWFDLDGLKLIAWPAASNHASSFMPSSSPRESRGTGRKGHEEEWNSPLPAHLLHDRILRSTCP